jgi:multicomponent Na+:H+ antiporter subunit D
MSALDALRGSSLLPVFLLLSSLVPGLLIAALREGQVRARTMLNVSGAVAKVLLVALMLWGVAEGRVYRWRCCSSRSRRCSG